MIATIEIPQGSKFKFEYDKTKDKLVLDRILNQPIPYAYGFFNNTMSQDGDALDVFVICSGELPVMSEVNVEIIGGFSCIDNDIQDDKLIGRIIGDDTYPRIGRIRDYLESYKDNFKVIRELSESESNQIYQNCRL